MQTFIGKVIKITDIFESYGQQKFLIFMQGFDLHKGSTVIFEVQENRIIDLFGIFGIGDTIIIKYISKGVGYDNNKYFNVLVVENVEIYQDIMDKDSSSIIF